MASRWRATPRLAVLSVVASALLSLFPAAARAQARAIALDVIGARDEAAPLEDTIRELLARLNLALVVEGAPVGAAGAPDAVLGHVHIDLSSPADAVLVVTDGRTGAVRLHRTIPRDPSAAIVREEIAHAVQSAIEAELLAEKDPTATPEPAPAPPPPPVIAPPPPPPQPIVREEPRAPLGSPPSNLGLDLTTLGGVGPIANGAGPSARIGAGLVGMIHAPVRLSLGLTFLYAWPFDTGTTVVSAHTSIVSVRAVPAIEILHARWIALDLGAGGGVNVITVDPRSDDLPSSNLGTPTTRPDFVLSGVASVHVAITAGVVFLLSAAADVNLASRQYVLAQGSTDNDVLAPWRVRPMFLAGFGFTALGDGHFITGVR